MARVEGALARGQAMARRMLAYGPLEELFEARKRYRAAAALSPLIGRPASQPILWTAAPAGPCRVLGWSMFATMAEWDQVDEVAALDAGDDADVEDIRLFARLVDALKKPRTTSWRNQKERRSFVPAMLREIVLAVHHLSRMNRALYTLLRELRAELRVRYYRTNVQLAAELRRIEGNHAQNLRNSAVYVEAKDTAEANEAAAKLLAWT